MEDTTLWLRIHPEPGPGPIHWAASAFDFDELISATLIMDQHWIDATEPELVSLAAGDLDFDNNEEIALVTRVRTPSPAIALSLLSLAVSPTITITQVATFTIMEDVVDISVAIGAPTPNPDPDSATAYPPGRCT